MDALVTFYQAVPPAVWAFIFGTPLIVLIVNVSKKLFGTSSTLVIHTLTVTFSTLVTVLPEIISHNPKPGLYNTAFVTAFFTAANFLYAASKKLAPFFAAVKEYEDKKKASALSAATTTAIAEAGAKVSSVSSTAGVVEPAPTVTKVKVSVPTDFEG